MVEIKMKKAKRLCFDEVVHVVLAELFGKPSCRQRVGRMSSLSVGFGERIPHGKPRMVDDFYGEWELGTYSAKWNISSGEEILCSNHNISGKDLIELDEKVNKLPLGKIRAIEFVSKSFVLVRLDGDIHIDFIVQDEEDDENEEFFHVFCPNNVFVACSFRKGWIVDKRK
jgi:hypothetical protein